MNDQLVSDKLQEIHEQADALYQEAVLWAKDTIYSTDDGKKLRPLFEDINGDMFFHAHWSDFDGEEVTQERFYLSEFDGYDDQYEDAIRCHFKPLED